LETLVESRRSGFPGDLRRVKVHLYRTFFRNETNGVLFATVESEILDANEEACRSLGRPREELFSEGGGAIFDP
jgi:PAS domain-containing protein